MGVVGGSERKLMECTKDMHHKTDVFKVANTELQFFTCVECKEVHINLDYFRLYLNERHDEREKVRKRFEDIKNKAKEQWSGVGEPGRARGKRGVCS